MAILLAATSTGDLAVTVSAVTAITASAEIAPYVDEGFRCDDNGTEVSVLLASPVTTLWGSFFHYKGLSNNVTGAHIMFGLYGPSNVGIIRLVRLTASSTLSLQRWNGSTWVVLDETIGVIASTLNRMDFRLVMHASAGVFEMWRGGAKIYEFTGINTNPDSLTGCVKVRFGKTGASGNLYRDVYSGLVLADTNTRGMAVVQRRPSANGANTAWTNDVGSVSATGDGGTSFIEAATEDLIETFTFPNLPAGVAGQAPLAVVVAGRGTRGATGPQTIQAAARVGGTDYRQDAEYQVDTVVGPFYRVMANNPATGNPWSQAQINDAEFGVASKA